MEENPLVLLAQVEQVADFLGRESLDVAQRDDHPLAIGQLRQGVLQSRAGLERSSRRSGFCHGRGGVAQWPGHASSSC